MANSFISINEKGFWAYDYLIEGMQLMLIEELSNSEYEIFDWISEYKIQLANSNKGKFKNAKNIKETIQGSYWKGTSKNQLKEEYYIKGLKMLSKLVNGKIEEKDEYELLNK